MAKRDRIQLGEHGGRLVLPDEDLQLVSDKLAATAREDERPPDEALAVLLVLLVDTGRGASDVATLWKHDVADGALPLRTGWRASKEAGRD